ncbi:MAG: hypothetical protein Q7V57_01585 [Actinomycetota bacterium]|nr:hypothetical protein [Actinomycetota bacterium]
MSYEPPFPPGGQRPRSTPIPGDVPFQSPIQDAPPTPAEFLGAPTPTDLAPPMHDARAVPTNTVNLVPHGRKSRGGAGMLVMAIIVISMVIGIGAAVWGVIQATKTVETASNTADEYSNPQLSDNDREALGLVDGEHYLWEGGAPAALAVVLDGAIPGTPTNFTSIDLYTDYSFATAQDPTRPDRLDRYSWRIGEVGAPEPQQNDATAPSKVFTITDMNWGLLAQRVAEAPSVLNVEDGEVTYVFVSRDSFDDAAPVVARIYVTGPRSSGYLVVGADGTILESF